MTERRLTLGLALALALVGVGAGVAWSEWWLLAGAVCAGTAATWMVTEPAR